MFDSVLTTISNQLNSYLRNRGNAPGDGELTMISRLVNEDGTSAVAEANAIIISLLNIQQENVASRTGGHGAGNRPINLNMFVLFSASFHENYMDNFRYLSGVVSFFQANPVMNHSNAPELDGDINKLTFEIENLDTAAVSQLWGAIGAKHMPFVLYKVRMVTVNEMSGMGTSTFSGLNN
jgi:hypothetical protein